MTRLLQTMAGARHGGAEAFFERLAVALERAGQVQAVAIRRDADRAGKLRAGGVAVTELAFGGRLDWTTRPGLRRLIRDFRPDVALSWMNRATSMLPAGDFVRVARLGGYYDLKYYATSDHLIGNTRDIVDYLVRSGWPAERAHYLPNFVAAAAAAPAARAGFATPDEAPLLLALGRLHPVKGFDVLLHALAQLPGAHLWIAGEGEERASLVALASRLGLADRVRFLGWRDDTAALLAAADLIVCPSRQEPLGNVVIEAWAQRRPVVASRTPGPASLIEEGRTGLLVAIEDADGLARAIARVLAAPDLGAAFAAEGRSRYERDFTEAAIVAAYRGFIDRVSR